MISIARRIMTKGKPGNIKPQARSLFQPQKPLPPLIRLARKNDRMPIGSTTRGNEITIKNAVINILQPPNFWLKFLRLLNSVSVDPIKNLRIYEPKKGYAENRA